MIIRRDELRKVDFSDVASGKRLAPVHPGAVLLRDFIEPMGVSRYRVAKNIGVAQRRIDLICRGDAAVSAEMALRLGSLFGTTPEFWVNLQSQGRAVRDGAATSTHADPVGAASAAIFACHLRNRA
ncbi:MAG: HigA family addiction module antidote protein [Betaproteobacteria bacterium]|nr:HigA family addiction module antidote protein [Betaproteobacteria bacterium]